MTNKPASEFSHENNPFTDAAFEPFVDDPFARHSVRSSLAVEEGADPSTYTYAMVARGAPVSTDETERSDAEVTEVMVQWDNNTLIVDHLDARGRFTLGETDQNANFVVPTGLLGQPTWTLIERTAAGTQVNVPPGATATLSNGETATAEASGSVAIALGSKMTIRLGDLTFRIGQTAAGKPSPKGLAAVDRSTPAYFALSAFAHAAIIGAMAFFVPPLGLTDGDGIEKERLIQMQAYRPGSGSARGRTKA